MKLRRTAAASLAAIGLMFVAACSGTATSNAGAKGTGGAATPTVLTIAASAAVTTWDPVRSFSTEALYLGNVYEPLLWKNPSGSAEEYRPGIATAWETSADGKTWTFTIREGATFHTGEPVDADAVKASIEAAQAYGGASFIWAPLKSIEAPDPTTVVMKLAYAAPMDLVASSTYGAWIVAPSALKASAKDEKYFQDGIDAGTGPYTLSSYKPGSKVVLTKYDDYWDTEAAATYPTVDISITSDAVTAQQMLTTGEVDYSTSVPLENVEQLGSNPDLTVNETKSPFNYVALFNTKRPPLDDPKVRQALSYAIPYQDIIDVGALGYGTQAHGPVPDGIFPFDADVPMYTQDLDKAAQLLSESGHDGGGFELTLTYASENSSEARFVPLIKDAFAKIGVDVTVEAKLFNQQWEEAKADPAKAQDIFVLYYWPTYSDAGSDNLYSLFHSSEAPFFNLSYWDSPEFDKTIDEAATYTASDRDRAQGLYSEAMNMLYEQAPGAFLYDARSISVVPNKLSVPQYNENYPFTTFFSSFKPA